MGLGSLVMAIDTINEKLAVMEWNLFWEPGLPISPGAFGDDDKQQLLWDNPSPLWSGVSVVSAGNQLLELGRRSSPMDPGGVSIG